MTTLSPKLASQLASSTYSLTGSDASFFRESTFGTSYIRDNFSFKEIGIGRTGGFILNRHSGFAAVGVGKGQYQGDAVIAVRGTEFSSKADWATNAQVGLTASDAGQIVHAGFNNAFNSLKPQFATFLTQWRKNNPGKAIHCVGHSLGGAIASLTADWAAHSNYASNVNLYTFGAPRVGQTSFATKNTNRLHKIHRCTHGADIVPKVPLWPFIHAPFKGSEYRLDNSQGIRISAHGMDPKSGANPGYLTTANTEDWGQLSVKANEFLQPVTLRYENRNQASYSDYWCDRLSAALITTLKRHGYYAAVAAQATASGALTLYDLIAKTLLKISEAAKTAADEVRGLLGHMLAFAGSVVTVVTDLTFITIRTIFEKMLKRLYEGVKQAIKFVHK
ncbi:lipase family protein [Shewanella sp. 1_MG-2023]|uniref:lipase family protein n=1 Tax=unclassified Shewanella TaxID=196818 RepID=UPI0026E1BE2B|nr:MULTISPECIES: lipase family protein [unclassified Shewanella]MDO6611321.1 lipase family protein [Shewanella sp. 7_MG-2023]MDO6771176.1 lipase family protein [Shewanella sp. 2_MG-2023]MDO6795857.1 lipase family protein [Shewanella sp. 1_MG-2023]